jgi:hypothetical protein
MNIHRNITENTFAPALAPAINPKRAIAMTARRAIVPLIPAGTEIART